MNAFHILRTCIHRSSSGLLTNVCCKHQKRLISSTKLTAYTTEEQSLIIETLQKCVENNTTRTHLNVNRLKNLKTVFDQNPDLNSLEPLLTAGGLGPKILEKICDSILHPKDNISNQQLNSEENSLLNLRWPSNLLTPVHITPGDIRSTVSIHSGINCISWARLDVASSTTLDVWDVLDLTSTADKKFDVHSIWALALELRDLIPDADVYVMENCSWSNIANVKKPMKQHVQDAMLTTALCSTFNLTDQDRRLRESPQNRIYFLRTFAPARIFRKMIGSERVSAHDVVENMINGVEDDRHRRICFDQDVIERYRSMPGFLRDNMGQALLLGVSFTELILFNNPVALAAIGNSRKKKTKPAAEQFS